MILFCQLLVTPVQIVGAFFCDSLSDIFNQRLDSLGRKLKQFYCSAVVSNQLIINVVASEISTPVRRTLQWKTIPPLKFLGSL